MGNDIGTTKITILVDNEAGPGLLAEHGFSALVETAGRRILFDSGQGPALAHNVERIGVALATVDTLVLSHGHYDHAGGLPLVVEHAPGVDVYCHPAATVPRYSIDNGTAKPVDMPDAARLVLLNIAPERMHWIIQPTELAPGVGITGPIPRLTDYENTGGPFYVDADGAYADPIADDQALWLRTEQGLVVVVGCSHSGLINTLRHVQLLSGGSRIRAVIGGFHLVEASTARIDCTIEALCKLTPEMIVACHCTGAQAFERIRQTIGERMQLGAAGLGFTFGGTSAAT